LEQQGNPEALVPRSTYRIFDTDVHHQYPSLSVLDKYMPEGNTLGYYTRGGALPNTGGAYRKDAVPPGGGVPGSDPAFLIEDHMDKYGIEYAILNPASLLGLGGLPDIDLAAAIASATNDWTANEWLPLDDRFLGAICIAPRDPQLAAAEVRRMAPNPRFVQVTVTAAPLLLGNRFYYPIYEACEELGLPFCFHVGGQDQGVNGGSYPLGSVPSTFCEYHFGMCVPAIYHVVSLVTEGVFERFPNLMVVMNEFGVAWLPFVLWRLDMEYRANRIDVPWLTKLPSEYVKERMRFTTQPLEEPENPRDLVTMLELLEAERWLVFSSDYPHWDSDNPDWSLRAFPDDWKQKIFWDNAASLYRLDERLAKVA
jgi:predicted TIM-barrel fold metal-dependent hydrolase